MKSAKLIQANRAASGSSSTLGIGRTPTSASASSFGSRNAPPSRNTSYDSSFSKKAPPPPPGSATPVSPPPYSAGSGPAVGAAAAAAAKRAPPPPPLKPKPRAEPPVQYVTALYDFAPQVSYVCRTIMKKKLTINRLMATWASMLAIA